MLTYVQIGQVHVLFNVIGLIIAPLFVFKVQSEFLNGVTGCSAW
jgi:hypothetical protein